MVVGGWRKTLPPARVCERGWWEGGVVRNTSPGSRLGARCGCWRYRGPCWRWRWGGAGVAGGGGGAGVGVAGAGAGAVVVEIKLK